ncbi:AraC family transcriptional regulator [Aquibacillus rhizosphaerae]|uniref:AraC family transcriptional regulator n=1 Tax=Aquibacillus rhizosphaerae TaxID=3051431 RepID=A0ABT7L8F3_9BACI|nr:AraC family transcriptional regulator [Aquibacillus sp. LR5S19]MDL4842142.1 AraC family transcriptional regulator [Aquibacillus sp. LR5S19]
MNNRTDVFDKLATYLYKLNDIKHVTSNRMIVSKNNHALQTLLIILDGKGNMVVGGKTLAFHRRQAFVLPSELSVQIRLDEKSLIDCFIVQFHVFNINDKKERESIKPVFLNWPVEIEISNVSLIINMVKEMKHKLGKSSFNEMKANILFQEMLVTLFVNDSSGKKESTSDRIALTKDYIEQNYSTVLSRKSLAEIAGMNIDYYSRLFKQQVGKTPVEYLTEVRIRHAKNTLITSNETSRSIAQKVGFKDEFYFSRKFKAETGFSPSVYVKKTKESNKVVSLKHLLTGHFIALNVDPFAAIINDVYPVTKKLQHTIDLEESNLDTLMRTKPDLIITREERDCDDAEEQKILSQIAPTISLPFYGDWKSHFKKIASVLERENEADLWLEQYEIKAQKIERKLEGKVGMDSIIIVGVGKGKLCVYGQRNIGTVIYDDLLLRAPKAIEEIPHYQEVSIDDLHRINADRMIITTYKHNGTKVMNQMIQQEIHRLFQNVKWNELKAVRNNQVYPLYGNQHLYTCYTSFSHNLLLDKVNQLILS